MIDLESLKAATPEIVAAYSAIIRWYNEMGGAVLAQMPTGIDGFSFLEKLAKTFEGNLRNELKWLGFLPDSYTLVKEDTGDLFADLLPETVKLPKGLEFRLGGRTYIINMQKPKKGLYEVAIKTRFQIEFSVLTICFSKTYERPVAPIN